jgi:hypothetical protein
MAKKALRAALGLLAGALLLCTCQNAALEQLDRTVERTVRIFPAPDHGSLVLSSQRATEGATVVVYVNPDPGYKLQDVGLIRQGENGGNASYVTKVGPRYQLSCPATNLNITGIFEEKPAGTYTITIDKSIQNGIVFSDPLCAKPGTTVKLYYVPDTGYDLTEGSLNLDGESVAGDGSSFTLPERDVTVSAAFEKRDFSGLVSSARKSLAAGKYDAAASFYEEVYKIDKDDPEAILYTSFAKLGGLIFDSDVRSLLSGSLHFSVVPTTLEDLICDDTWEGNESDCWYTTYSGTTYTPEDAVLPKINVRFSGFSTPFGDFDIAQASNTREKFRNLIFWGLIASNTGGFNDFLDKVNHYVFGANFEAIAARADSLPEGAQVLLSDRLKERLNLEDIYGAGDTYIGKAEVQFIFGELRAIKAAFEFLAAYDWTIDLRPMLTSEIKVDDGLDDILDHIFSLAKNKQATLWSDPAKVNAILPFKNNFLTLRNVKYLTKAKDDATKALDMTNAAMAFWYGESSNFSAEAKASHQWARDGLAAAKTALASDGVFYFPKKLPKSAAGAQWPDSSTADYAVDLGAFLKPGAFSLTKLFTTEWGGLVPSMFKIKWYEDPDNGYQPFLTEEYSIVKGSLPSDDSEENVSGTNSAPWGLYSFELNTAHLKELFPKGFTSFGDKALFCKVFPTIPLWPSQPTYMEGGTAKGARALYDYYHLR